MRHVGIVACSAEGAALCYRTLCSEGAKRLGPQRHPEVTIHTPPLEEYIRRIERDDWRGVGDLMLASADKLASAGADFLICPDNTLHQAMPYVRPRSGLPWLHIAEIVAETASQRGFRRLGILGTSWLVKSSVYPEKLIERGIEYVRPTDSERDEIGRIIMEELIYAEFKPESVAYIEGAIAEMQSKGCDAVVLGCTELPLVIDDSNSALPTLDSSRLLARAALEYATSPDGSKELSAPL